MEYEIQQGPYEIDNEGGCNMYANGSRFKIGLVVKRTYKNPNDDVYEIIDGCQQKYAAKYLVEDFLDFCC